MDAHEQRLSLGLPRIRNEDAEVRDFLPPLVRIAGAAGADVLIETGCGQGMGFRDDDYLAASPRARIVDRPSAFGADIVLVLRPPDEIFELLRAGTTFVSMLHFPTHKGRTRRFKEHGIDAVALDLIVDDHGRRLVENMRAVAWNGLDVGFGVLADVQPNFFDRNRKPTRVTILGAGKVGRHAVEAATKCGGLERANGSACRGLPGIEVVVVGRNLSADESYMRRRLGVSDMLVDATMRSDPSKPVVPNGWLAELPRHAVIVDLAVDLYLPDDDPPVVRGIEGIPAGDLERYVFAPDDPAWDALPPEVPDLARRWTVSCYSWPGVKPVPCMEHYGIQLEPLLLKLIERGGARFLRETGSHYERALWRASIGGWYDRIS